jgi:hypothetical protein
MERVAMNTSTKSLQLLSLLIADFCNKIGTKRPIRNVRYSAAIEGEADLARTCRDRRE